jgi:hypothetical protein
VQRMKLSQVYYRREHRENMHGKGRFAQAKESATLYLSSTCSTVRRSRGRPPGDRENIYILIDSFTT